MGWVEQQALLGGAERTEGAGLEGFSKAWPARRQRANLTEGRWE